MAYEPSFQSLKKHTVPEWFHDAKLGIFIHWGLYSVPGWAPTTGKFQEVVAREGWEGWFSKNPYAEWYVNSIRIKGSPSYHYHIKTYGEDFPYDNFVPVFNEAVQNWNPNQWANLFKKIGARYVVLTTKHHDGFLLWPSETPNPKKQNYYSQRDLVGELTRSVLSKGMRMGLYYSGGLDFTFNDTVIKSFNDILAAIPQSPEYAAYANKHWKELIDRYQPSILWNDIGHPAAANPNEIFAYYYNKFPEGVVNDRFALLSPPDTVHFDFRTPEYASFDQIWSQKWECTRGLGYSFGYNRNEGPEHIIPLKELVHSLVDIVSKNGNLLLGVGPTADGTIPNLQRKRLLELGQWLQTNGEAIFDTRPWLTAEGTTKEGIALRFTQKKKELYVILLERPEKNWITINSLHAVGGTTVQLLGYDKILDWKQEGNHLRITLPKDLRESPAYALKISPKPHKVS
ncbi:MAG: alpha-L-fucosidase [Candidatus Jordarchaeaceae archaeon]